MSAPLSKVHSSITFGPSTHYVIDGRLTRTEVLLELTSILRAADKSAEELVNYDKSKDTFTNASTVNPYETPFSSSTTKIFTRPQQVVIASKPSKIAVGDTALSIRLENKILKSHIIRFDEGDRTRWDFFQRVCIS